MIFRARYLVGVAHVTVRIFSASAVDRTFANIGTLVMRTDDWVEFKIVLQRGHVELVDDNDNPTG